MVTEKHRDGCGNMVDSELGADLVPSAESDSSTDEDEHASSRPSSKSPLPGQPSEGKDQTSPLQDSQDWCSSGTMKSSSEPHPKRLHNLLDLPIDVLKEVVKEITHMNDLASLALTCSAFHSLAIPHIYSRFDIVWPDTLPASEHPTGVDALSYGLATLVMGQDVFRGTPYPSCLPPIVETCSHCCCNDPHMSTAPNANGHKKLRRGNYYAKYTRKFSVGNGPSEFMPEYAITKETGKMLGTLVALAVARMVNLESFVWDMPTGVLRDVWLALASLADRPGHKYRLERIWVRWHDNSDNRSARAMLPSNAPVNFLFSPPQVMSLSQRYSHVEYPTLSVLPPLKSLTVLDIDEPSYLEEMEVLIERSKNRLRELRIGIVSKGKPDWTQPLEDMPPDQDGSESVIPGWPRNGGVLSVLLSKDNHSADCHIDPSSSRQGDSPLGRPALINAQEPDSAIPIIDGQHSDQLQIPVNPIQGIHDVKNRHLSSSAQLSNDVALDSQNPTGAVGQPIESSPGKIDPQSLSSSTASTLSSKRFASPEGLSNRKLHLEILELEEISLSVPVILKAIDWRRLTSLTVLRCGNNEQLWRALRGQYSPTNHTRSLPATPPQPCEGGRLEKRDFTCSDYALKIKNLHTDAVSPYLILFLKEAIAPNSLESLFLQERPMYQSIVSIDAIYQHVVRRQRASLKKLLVDSTDKHTRDACFRKWMVNREMLSFVTSGRMPHLRELGIAIASADWHFFLQRLPHIANLRALHFHHIDDRAHRSIMEPRELALQILDVVTLRPEIKLCYIGIETKCFEILEARNKWRRSTLDETDGSQDDAVGSDDGNDEAVGNNDSQDVDGAGTGGNHDDSYSGASSLAAGDDYSEDEENDQSYGGPKITFKLREILFYDDKISIFKARHGKI